VRRGLLGLLLAAAALGGATLAYRLLETDAQVDPDLITSYGALVTYGSAPKAAGRHMIPDTPTLAAAVAWAETSLHEVRKIRDYTCTLIKRERVADRLIGPQYLTLKVRQQPYSVYVHYVAPQSVRNQEAIYVEGRNDGKLLAHSTGVRHRLVGTVALKPTSALAIRGKMPGWNIILPGFLSTNNWFCRCASRRMTGPRFPASRRHCSRNTRMST
jgi:hypothetical protein